VTDFFTRLQEALGTSYRLERELGGGGMSRVFVAEETSLGRRVVIKVLPPEFAAVLSADRFRREIQLAASLNHPHIVPLLSAGVAGDLLYYTMPLVEGESLRAKLAREGELPIGEAVRILKEVVDALAHAHEHGVVHRDIKPDNVLLSKNHAVVTDFGVAKALSEATGANSITSTGMALGTPAYMAPEQAMADPHADHRADIYAAGALAYEMLTGRPPFTGASPQAVLAAHVTQAPAMVTESRASVPPALASLVMRCLEKKPADRWQRAEELLQQLESMATPSGGTTPAVAATSPASVLPRGTGGQTLGLPRAARWRSGYLLLGIVLALTAAWLVARTRRNGSPVAAGTKSVAVLPFENLGDSADAYFADGITEEIINRLTSVGGLRVIPRSSAMQYKGSNKPTHQIGDELGVGYLLEGTVRWDKLPDGTRQVRVSPELIKVADGTNVWAHGYEAVMSGVFKVQSDIAEQVTSALGIALADTERLALNTKPTDNPEAYEAYLRGRAAFNNGVDEVNARLAVASYERALQLDPHFAVAQAALAEGYSELFWFFYDRSVERLAHAKSAADEALRLQPDLPEGHRALGYYYYWGHLDYENALREFNLALVRQPANSDVLFAIAAVKRRQGKWDEAAANFKKAAELDPRSALENYNLGETYFLMRQYAEAERYIDRALMISPDWSPESYMKARIMVAARGDLAGAHLFLRSLVARMGIQRLAPPVAGPYGSSDAYLVTGDSALWESLRGATVAPFGRDSAGYFLLKGELFRQQHDSRLARAYNDSARVALEAQVRAHPEEDFFHARLGQTYARLGRYPEAILESTKATQLLPLSREAYRGGLNLLDLARVYTLAGEPEKAVDLLRQLLAIPSTLSVSQLRTDPSWQPLRGNPGFDALVAATAQPK